MDATESAAEQKRCMVHLIHADKSEARCALHSDHTRFDTDHRDEHGCRAPVLVSQATLDEVRRLQNVPFPCERP